MLKTPFMLELIVKVLPTMISNATNDAKIKEKILRYIPTIGEKIWKFMTSNIKDNNFNILTLIKDNTAQSDVVKEVKK